MIYSRKESQKQSLSSSLTKNVENILYEEWYNILLNIIRNLDESKTMPEERRIQAVLKANRNPTR